MSYLQIHWVLLKKVPMKKLNLIHKNFWFFVDTTKSDPKKYDVWRKMNGLFVSIIKLLNNFMWGEHIFSLFRAHLHSCFHMHVWLLGFLSMPFWARSISITFTYLHASEKQHWKIPSLTFEWQGGALLTKPLKLLINFDVICCFQNLLFTDFI